MSWTQIASLAAAAVVAVLPPLRSLPRVIPSSKPSYQEAIANLAFVRKRLLLTETLGDPQKKAIDALTLALVEGSDK